jgi:hypothetical protein
MSNPFLGIITPSFKLLHKQMIEAVLADEALTVPCTLYYSGTKFTECPNCIFDSINKRSTNRYKSGGPVPFSNSVCPYCQGVGRKASISTEPMYLATIWDSKQWILSNPNIKMADISVQTMSVVSTYDNLKRASKVQIDDTIKGYGIADFERVGDPEPLGLGDNAFVICSWKRI